MAFKPKNTTSWIFCFAGWLTTRKEVIKLGASEDCAGIASLVEEFRIERGLPEAEWERESVEEEAAECTL